MRRTAGDDDALDRWVEGARRGDRDAFGQLWLELAPRVAGYLRGRGVLSPDDVTSEVFLAAFRGIDGFDGDGSNFRSWLFTIAHHKAVDDIRRRRETVEYQADNDPRHTSGVDETVIANLIDPALRAALAALTDEQAEVLLLRAVGEMSNEDIAKVTGRTSGAVKQLHRRACAAARRHLAEQSHERSPVPAGPTLTMTEV